MEKATFGGGCFWCLEAVFEQVKGVRSVVSGYAGGTTKAPSYEAVCSGTTGHAEVVQLVFDPAVISYQALVELFFAIHDPTTSNRQGNDVGTQYRSVIFTHTAGQMETAQQVMGWLKEQNAFGAPIVTQLLSVPEFYPAEDYHQGYFRRHPGQGYCAFVVAPKVAKFRQHFRQLLRDA